MNLLSKFILLADATAAAGNDANPNSLAALASTLFLPALLLVLMYFMLIRPQKKRQKEERKMRDNLRVGDELITIGYICGRVVNIKEDTVTIESGADRTKIQLRKEAIQTVLTQHDDPVDDDDDDDDI